MNIRATLAGMVASLALAGLAGAAGAATSPVLQVPRLQLARPAIDADKLRMVQEVAAGRVEVRDLGVLGEPVRLDVRHAFATDAKLTFESAHIVSGGDNRADFENLPGQQPRLRIEFRAPSAGFYVVDAAIRGGADHGGGGARTIELAHLGGGTQSAAMGGGDQRIMIFVDARAAGWQTVFLQSRDTAWTFRWVEVSRFK
jgi:hypothetical protein